MLKRAAAIGLHAILIIGLIGFFGFRGNISRSEAAESSIAASAYSPRFTGELEHGVTIRVLENDTAIQQGYFEELIDAFNAAYAEQGIKAVDANMDQYLDLENDGPYGYGPDVLYQANDVLMKYVDGNHILALPPDALEAWEQIPASAWEAYQAQGGIYGVPVNIQAPVLYYRSDMIPDNWRDEWDGDKNGVPDMLESWGAMYRFSRGIREGNPAAYGYMKSLWDPYFALGYLFSYGGYIFGEDTYDIGLSAGDAAIGAGVIRQLASVMNEDCIDDTVTKNGYAKLASGEYFAVMTTPDVYTLFTKEFNLAGTPVDNLGVAAVPALPADGDLSGPGAELIPFKVMGGVNGYAVSSYTKAPNACLAFVNFASGYDMMLRRNALLGIVPARADAASEAGGLSEMVNKKLADNEIVIMPSVRALAQVWTPAGTLFSDIAKDPYRPQGEMKYTEAAAFQEGLEKAGQQIYDAIHTLQ
ncbi:MAG: extracellular solute-binding protein [Clostridiales bacterium]|jgi:arabinogalactan oligomer/maltooligosaccharide transport system substrate-binding protein|nr:extracellular solute-binding protein [Clostridiales bacterium]